MTRILRFLTIAAHHHKASSEASQQKDTDPFANQDEPAEAESHSSPAGVCDETEAPKHELFEATEQCQSSAF